MQKQQHHKWFDLKFKTNLQGEFAVPGAHGRLRILVLSKKAYAGHPGFHSFRALAPFNFS